MLHFFSFIYLLLASPVYAASANQPLLQLPVVSIKGLLIVLAAAIVLFVILFIIKKKTNIDAAIFKNTQALVIIALIAIVAIPLTVMVSLQQQKLTSRAAAGSLTVTSVQENNSAVRVTFQAVNGAKDYRIYDVTNPNNVKYAGLDNSNSPATQIDYNSVGDGQPHTLIVEAVDQLGPVPHMNLYDPNTNLPLISPLPAGAMLGGNKALTDDGKTSTNGQGPYTDNPQVLAQSQPFIVQANRNYKAIPSKSDAFSTIFDTFDNSEAASVHQISRNDTTGLMNFTLNSGTALSATIQYQLADNLDSMPFISNDHFMDVLFDGGTPGSNNPLHQGHAVMAYSPDTVANVSSGQMLHITEEVDGHTDARRWMDIVIVPANDPARAFDALTNAYNQTNDALKVELFNNDVCTLNVYNGPAGGTQLPTGVTLWGAAGQAPIYCGMPYNGLSFDNKSRFDFFVTQQHAALFIDGKLIIQSDIPAGSFPWFNQPLKVYLSHYLYHSDNDINELLQYHCQAINSFWFNNPLTGTASTANGCNTAYPTGYGFPRSDERHWDNMGFEVLPANDIPSPTDFSTLASVVQPPSAVAPTFVNGTITQVPTNTPIPTSTPIAGSTPTNTPVPSTPTPTSPSGQSVSGFSIIDETTNAPIAAYNPIQNNASIDVSTFNGHAIDIQANTNPATVGSVRFDLDGTTNFHTENTAPYALIADAAGVFNAPWNYTLGSHTITATPFTAANLTGTAGTAMTTTFTLTNGTVTPTSTPVPPTNTPVPPTPTFTPTPTQIPTNTPAPTNTPVPNTASLNLTVKLHGIAQGGDNANPNGIGNLTPLHPQRNVSVTLFNSLNAQVAVVVGFLNFDPVSGTFKTTLPLPNSVPSGIYTIRVTVPGFLSNNAIGIVSLTSGQTTTVSPIALVTGDINGDNSLSLLDYNALLNCYGQTASGTCIASDINDDGTIDLKDINLLLREFSTQIGF